MLIYNTYTREKEEFKPIEENKVKMYRLTIVYKQGEIDKHIIDFRTKQVAEYYKQYYYNCPNVAYASIDKIEELK